MKKGSQLEWDQSYQETFNNIKKCLSNPLVLGESIPWKPLALDIAAQEKFLRALYTQENEESKEGALKSHFGWG